MLCQAMRPCQVIPLDDGLQFYQMRISGTAQPQGDPILMCYQGGQVH